MNAITIASIIHEAIKEIEAAAPAMGESQASIIAAFRKLAEAFEQLSQGSSDDRH
jgi:hypothetical protein